MTPNPQRKLPLHATRPAESSEPQVEPWQESPARKRPFNSVQALRNVRLRGDARGVFLFGLVSVISAE
jgi:hypothetical protein